MLHMLYVVCCKYQNPHLFGLRLQQRLARAFERCLRCVALFGDRAQLRERERERETERERESREREAARIDVQSDTPSKQGQV